MSQVYNMLKVKSKDNPNENGVPYSDLDWTDEDSDSDPAKGDNDDEKDSDDSDPEGDESSRIDSKAKA